MRKSLICLLLLAFVLLVSGLALAQDATSTPTVTATPTAPAPMPAYTAIPLDGPLVVYTGAITVTASGEIFAGTYKIAPAGRSFRRRS